MAFQKRDAGKSGPATFLFLFLCSLWGCAPVISPELKANADPSARFQTVLQDPAAYRGKLVIWGGEILQVLPRGDGTTLLEVLRWPLNRREEPQRPYQFEGRFLVRVPGRLDPSIFKPERRITAAGEVQGVMKGEEIKELTDNAYTYPLLAGRQIHLWKEYFYPYSGPPYRDPLLDQESADRPLRF